MIYMFLSNNSSSGDINLSTLSCLLPGTEMLLFGSKTCDASNCIMNQPNPTVSYWQEGSIVSY